MALKGPIASFDDPKQLGAVEVVNAKPQKDPIGEPDMGHITFRSYVPRYEFTARLGDGAPVPTGGYGGWNPTQRHRRRSLTEWDGNDPMTIDIPVLFDKFRAGDSVEDDIQQLEYMAGWGGQGGEPPLISFNSAGVVPHDQHDAPSHDWVISGLAWGDADRNEYGNRTRQAVTITVMQYVEDDVLSDESAAQRRRAAQNNNKRKPSAHAHHSKTYIVKEGDTLAKIAAKKHIKNWHRIAELNHIRDPKNIHKGQHLRLP